MRVLAKAPNSTHLSMSKIQILAKAVSACSEAFRLIDPTQLTSVGARTVAKLLEIVASNAPENKSIETQAWIVVRSIYLLALARLFQTVAVKRPPSSGELEAAVTALLKRIETKLSEEKYFVSFDHLTFPLQFSLFRDEAGHIPHEFQNFVPIITPAEIRREFEASLVDGIMTLRKSMNRDLIDLAEYLTSPFAKSIEKRNAISRHHYFIVRSFSITPIFGQEESGLTLAQLYVKQRCTWFERQNPPRQLSKQSREVERKSPDPKEIFCAGDLHSIIGSWLEKKEADDWIRVVTGGPGSGKSSFARALSVDAIDNAKYDVLFVPLQDIEVIGTFEQRIGNLFRNRTDLGFDREENPLFWLGQTGTDGTPPTKPLLIICDGLDEMAPPDSNEASTVTTDFIQVLGTWLSRRNSNGCYVKALVLGRTVAAQEAFRKLGRDSKNLLSIAGLLPLNMSSDWRSYEDRYLIQGDSQLIQQDQRHLYWTSWCHAMNIPSSPMPEALKGGQRARALQELTTEPLLLYLLLWTGFLSQRWEQVADNRNIVYEEIFNRIYQREWGADAKRPYTQENDVSGGHPLTRNLSFDNFIRFQEALALGSWHTGGRTVSNEAYEAVAKIYIEPDLLEDLAVNSTISLKSIALQGYTRTAGSVSAGFEFVHKTLSEYLIAVALVKTLN